MIDVGHVMIAIMAFYMIPMYCCLSGGLFKDPTHGLSKSYSELIAANNQEGRHLKSQ